MRIILLLSVVLAFSCKGSNSNPEQTSLPPESLQTIEVSIQGMTCTGCEKTIQSNISLIEGVAAVKASHADGNAIINFNSELVDTTAIKEKIVASGYTVVAVVSKQK